MHPTLRPHSSSKAKSLHVCFLSRAGKCPMPHAQWLIPLSSQRTNPMPPPPKSLPGLFPLNRLGPKEIRATSQFCSCPSMLHTLGRLCAPETGLDKPQNPHGGGGLPCPPPSCPWISYDRAPCPCKHRRQEEKSRQQTVNKLAPEMRPRQAIWTGLNPCKVYSGKKNYLQGLRKL